MPSRFTGLAPHTELPSRHPKWDSFDDLPFDPAYIAPISLQACTRKPTP